MEGIVLRFDKETGQGLIRPLDTRPPRPLRFEVTTKKLKDKINVGTKVSFNAEQHGMHIVSREAADVKIIE